MQLKMHGGMGGDAGTRSYSPNGTDGDLDANQISPSWYFDMTQLPIGKHPTVSRRIWAGQMPDIMIKSVDQLANNKFDCRQPMWYSECS